MMQEEALQKALEIKKRLTLTLLGENKITTKEEALQAMNDCMLCAMLYKQYADNIEKGCYPDLA